MNYQIINAMVEMATEELGRLHVSQLEEAIEFAIRENCGGKIPSMEEIKRRGQIVRCAEGDDRYTEFQWDGKGQFRQRVVYNEDKHRLEIRLDYAPS